MMVRTSPPHRDARQPAQFFAAFDAIRIVNLPERTDRRDQMSSLLDRSGLKDDPRVEFFSAIASQDKVPFRRAGSRGAFLSHLTLLRQAAEAQHSILILQDDCDFLMDEVEAYRLPAAWDIFYGGYLASDPGNLPDSDIIGAHFMGFSPRAAAAAADYLTRYLEPDFAPDPRASSQPDYDPAIRPPIDGAFVWMRRAHPELVTVFKMLGVQRPSRTDIGDRKAYDRIPGLRRIIEIARRWRRGSRTGAMKEAVFGSRD